MPRVLIAADKFKGSLDAAGVAVAIARGLRDVRRDVDIDVVPVADGGEGTLAAAIAIGFDEIPVVATGPTGDQLQARFARRGELAVVELGDVSGLMRLPGGLLRPMTAGSRGTGEVMAAALDVGCRDIVLGLGGSASTDGGAGMLQGLGATLTDERGLEVASGGGSLASICGVELGPVRERLRGARVTVASDVDNPLTGPRGAAHVYAPQKGASPTQVVALDAGLKHWADRVEHARMTHGPTVDCAGMPGSGAAGGVGYAAISVLEADIRPGIELLLGMVGFADRLPGVDLVITGEGRLDSQTLHGKAPAGVAARARAAGVPVVAVCGSSSLDPHELKRLGVDAVYPLSSLEPDLRVCMEAASSLLVKVGANIARTHLGEAVRLVPGHKQSTHATRRGSH